jgi:hypothetical protein
MYARYMKYLFTLTLVLSGMTWAADPVPMDVKTGEWETTVTMQMGGLQAAGKMPAIPPEQLSKMPPEQRARIESAMKALGGAPTTTTSKNCVKPEDLTKMKLTNDQMSACKMTVVTATRTKQEAKMECDLAGGKQTGTTSVEAVSSDSAKFNVQLNGTGSTGQPFNMTINGTSKWLGPTCSGTK